MTTPGRNFRLAGLLLVLGWLPLAAPAQDVAPSALPPISTAEPTLAPAPVPAAPASAAGSPGTPSTPGSTQGPWRLAVNLDGGGSGGQADVGVQIVVVMTLITLAPSLLMMMTSFTRIVIVLGFVRTALGVPNAPANQIVMGLSLFLTLFVMGPVFDRVYTEGAQPYFDGKLKSVDALQAAAKPLREFMLKQTRTRDLEFFLQLGRSPPTKVADLPLRVVVPAFMISELQTAFQMGFLIFLPFLVIDLLVSSILMALGMMMMPPSIVSLPFKLLLFVLVDGWHLVVQSLVTSFHP